MDFQVSGQCVQLCWNNFLATTFTCVHFASMDTSWKVAYAQSGMLAALNFSVVDVRPLANGGASSSEKVNARDWVLRLISWKVRLFRTLEESKNYSS